VIPQIPTSYRSLLIYQLVYESTFTLDLVRVIQQTSFVYVIVLGLQFSINTSNNAEQHYFLKVQIIYCCQLLQKGGGGKNVKKIDKCENTLLTSYLFILL
jgi:hypothetical protein